MIPVSTLGRPDDVEAVFMLREDDPTLLLVPHRHAEARALAIAAAADVEPQPGGAFEGDRVAAGLVGGQEHAAALGADPRDGR